MVSKKRKKRKKQETGKEGQVLSHGYSSFTLHCGYMKKCEEKNVQQTNPQTIMPGHTTLVQAEGGAGCERGGVVWHRKS